MLSHSLVPEAASFWEGRGGPAAFRTHLVWIGVGSAVLSVVSVVVGRTLYSLQRTAHRARRLGNYLVERELGSGGMGEVYRARHAMIRRPTAVKVLRGEVLGTETARARFEREVQLSATLTHPNTITIFDYGRTEEDVFYYAMEYLNGLDLQRLVERFGPLPPERAVHLLLQVCGSLSEAHDRGVVHRDVKPANIFLTERGGICDFVKVLDFGLARSAVEARDGERDLTETGMVVGTPRYIAPESVYGSDRADARSDLYNLGAVAYWALVGRPLFEGSSGAALFVDHVNTDPPAPSEVSELEVPPALDRVVLTCLAKDPADRYASAAELAGALRGVPLDREWTAERAREWWTLHLPEEMGPLAPGSDGDGGEREVPGLLPGWPRPE
jgi:serine/threonine-protein kinase